MKTQFDGRLSTRIAASLAVLGLVTATALPALAVVTLPPTLSINRDGNHVTITVKGTPLTAYSFCSSLTGERSGTWSQITTTTADATGTASFTDGLNTDVSQQFYAVVQGENGTVGQPISLGASNVVSMNVVGYHNVICPPGFSLIANQLNAATNTLASLIPTTADGTTFFFYHTGSGYSAYVYDALEPGWTPNASGELLAPGGGAFVKNTTTSNLTFTFVGEVMQGSLTNICPVGFAIRSSKIPAAESLNTMKFPANDGDSVFVYNNLTGYSAYVYDSLDQGWTPGNISGPTIMVGQSFFTFQQSAKTWVRNFTVQ